MTSAFILPDEAKPTNSRYDLSQALASRLSMWLPGVLNGYTIDDGTHAHPRVTALVSIYDDALARLKGKTGARAETAREQISASRAPLVEQLVLVNGLGAGFDGPLSLEFRSRIDSTRAALAKVLYDIHLATRATVAELLVEKERCLADCRELERDLAAVSDGIIAPRPLPNPDEFSKAKQMTAALEAVPAKRVRATDVHGAIEQGMNTPPGVAALFVAYETKPDHPLVVWRAQALAERVA